MSQESKETGTACNVINTVKKNKAARTSQRLRHISGWRLFGSLEALKADKAGRRIVLQKILKEIPNLLAKNFI